MAFHPGFCTGFVHVGHQKVYAAEAAQEPIVSEVPADESESTAPKNAPTLPKLKKTAKVVPTRGTAAREEFSRVARSRRKRRERNRTRRENQTTTMATRGRKMIPSKYWRHSRSGSGRPPLTLMQVPMIRVRTSQRRKRRLLQVLVQSSSRHRVLVLSHPLVPLPRQLENVQWQEA